MLGNTLLNSASYIHIDISKEISLGNGLYITREYGGQKRYVLIDHGHGKFEGLNIMQAVCNDGYFVSKLPREYELVKKVLKDNNYILTDCNEGF